MPTPTLSEMLDLSNQLQAGLGLLVASPPVVSTPAGVPYLPPLPPAVTGAISLGNLTFNGARVTSVGMRAGKIAYASFTVPTGGDFTALIGKISPVSFAAVNSAGSFWKQVYLSQSPLDFTRVYPAFVQGLTATLNVAYGTPRSYAVTVNAGETWFFNLRPQGPFGGETIGPGVVAEFAITPAIPTVPSF